MRYVAGLLAVVAIHAATGAMAQQIGTRPYSAPAHNSSFAAQSQLIRKQAEAAGSAVITQNSTTSIALGNLNQISQILNGNAQGALNLELSQKSAGSQMAE